MGVKNTFAVGWYLRKLMEIMMRSFVGIWYCKIITDFRSANLVLVHIDQENIISPDFHRLGFGKSSSFNEDSFYSASFDIDPTIITTNKSFTFYS